jgi:beta-lactamase regulating signal transducer with metallopeptidase domain
MRGSGESAARRIGCAAPRVHVGDERMMPMVWGLFRPVLLLPAVPHAGRRRLEAVLLHELAHVRRRDALTQLVAELARAVYWFNPLVWIAARQMYLERSRVMTWS